MSIALVHDTIPVLSPGMPLKIVAMYDSEIGSHTAPSHLPVTIPCHSRADFHSSGTVHNGVPTSQHDIDIYGECRAYFFHLSDNVS